VHRDALDTEKVLQYAVYAQFATDYAQGERYHDEFDTEEALLQKLWIS
jgi:hypothetical protein